ncbi:MAG: hypothetical protein Q8S03_07250 [Brevundimonas sp.]|uniref:hypothetical protein n=1 Tax=Brevundimonas sp. TaxID=1871086 RepID=UPI0027331D2A|nr:hypothetical protein [Brevundimonas sp.]MDP3404470.1 hypothetical protein [Brevundimonas sp.]
MVKGVNGHRWLEALPEWNPVITARSYWICLDESGLETFQGNQPRFGFAGVAGFGTELRRARSAWRRLKRNVFGNEDAPMHGSGEKMSQHQLDAITTFFRDSRVKRFGFMADAPPIVSWKVDGLAMLRELMLQQLAAHLESLPKRPDYVVLLFESSERLSPKLDGLIPGIEIDGEPLDFRVAFATKSQGNEWLEMADQVAHRLQRQHRLGYDGTTLAEFRAVFPDPAVKHAELTLVRLDKVEYAGLGLTLQFDAGDRRLFRIKVGGDHPDANRIMNDIMQQAGVVGPRVFENE